MKVIMSREKQLNIKSKTHPTDVVQDPVYCVIKLIVSRLILCELKGRFQGNQNSLYLTKKILKPKINCKLVYFVGRDG